MRLYLAARWSRREEVGEYRDQLVELGHEVFARWIDDHPNLSEDQKRSKGKEFPGDPAAVAINCFEDVVKSDALVIFTEADSDKKRGKTAKGGMWVEFGIALGLNKDVSVVGPHVNTFCWYPTVMTYGAFDEFVDAIENGEFR